MYLRRSGWTDADTFSIETAAGEIRPTITGETTCRVDMGRAQLTSKDFPAADDGRGDVESAAERGASSTSRSATRSARSGVESRDELDGARPRPPSARRSSTTPQFPNRTNMSFWAELAPDRIRARIFERGVGETLSSGTGACGAAVAHVLRGGDSPVTVQLDGGELEVDVDEDLHVDLTGWAEPVYAGELSRRAARLG